MIELREEIQELQELFGERYKVVNAGSEMSSSSNIDARHGDVSP